MTDDISVFDSTQSRNIDCHCRNPVLFRETAPSPDVLLTEEQATLQDTVARKTQGVPKGPGTFSQPQKALKKSQKSQNFLELLYTSESFLP